MDDIECRDDWVEVDFQTKHCGQTTLPWSIVSISNRMYVRLVSNDTSKDRLMGFQANWTTTFEPPTYRNSFSGSGCRNCLFPFVYEGRSYDTCINDGDDGPYCYSGFTQPTEEGTHVSLMPNSQILCTESDSTCPSAPEMETHPNNEPDSCCKIHVQTNIYHN